MIILILCFLSYVEHLKKSWLEALFTGIYHVLFFAAIYVEKMQFKW